VFDSYDGSYRDPKIGDLHSQLYDPVLKINNDSRDELWDSNQMFDSLNVKKISSVLPDVGNIRRKTVNNSKSINFDE